MRKPDIYTMLSINFAKKKKKRNESQHKNFVRI